MREFLTLSVALWRLRLRLNRHGTFWLLAYGLLLPGAISLWARAQAPGRESARYVVVGTFVLGLHSILVRRAGYSIAVERTGGIWKLLATTRVTRSAYLAAQALDMLVLALVPMMGLMIASISDSDCMPRSALWLIPALLACVTFTSLALLIAGAVSAKLCGLITNVLSISTLAFCPMLYGPDRVPDAIWPVVKYLPQTVAMQSIVPTWNGEHAPSLAIALQVFWALTSSMLVIRTFPWHAADIRD